MKPNEIVCAAYLRESGIRAEPMQYTELYRTVYCDLVKHNLEATPGVIRVLGALRQDGFEMALVTSSQNI